jgi:hypothetical protein
MPISQMLKRHRNYVRSNNIDSAATPKSQLVSEQKKMKKVLTFLDFIFIFCLANPSLGLTFDSAASVHDRKSELGGDPGSNPFGKDPTSSDTRGYYYKTIFVRNLRIFVIG